ncbi:MAG: SMP-30/gluconolactonase/LRE family protein [Pirellulaceae bacterium]|nr:SMP-30/gluconolactonase/LRE family protein [Pirellulaceae bacterium]
MKSVVSLTLCVRIGLVLMLGVAGPFTSTTTAQEQADLVGTTVGSIQRLDPALDEILDSNAKLEVLGQGYGWAEGPIWIPTEKRLLFSDIPPNRVMQWRADEGVTLYQAGVGFSGESKSGGREPGTNGLMLSADGQVYACCHGDRVIKRRRADETWEVVIDNYQGKKFNSPNDLTFHKNGDLYFTDPPYGLAGGPDDPSRELDFCGVYRWDGKEVHLLTKELNRPNGIAFSPDYKTLYVAQSDSAAPTWTAYPVNDDGSLGKGKVLVNSKEFYGKDPGSPDGLKVDERGNLWATGPGGVWIIAPSGKVLGKIMTGRPTANCGFGGPDGSWLFMTANELLLKVPTKTKGLALPAP